MYSIWKIMCFMNIKACQHILLHQIHKIMIFKKPMTPLRTLVMTTANQHSQHMLVFSAGCQNLNHNFSNHNLFAPNRCFLWIWTGRVCRWCWTYPWTILKTWPWTGWIISCTWWRPASTESTWWTWTGAIGWLWSQSTWATREVSRLTRPWGEFPRETSDASLRL